MGETLTLVALAAQPERYQLIDLRDALEFAVAHVEGALNIPLADLATRADEIPAGLIPVAVCNWGGSRSAEGAAMLRRLGHEGTLTLEGGTQAWLAAAQKLALDVPKPEER